MLRYLQKKRVLSCLGEKKNGFLFLELIVSMAIAAIFWLTVSHYFANVVQQRTDAGFYCRMAQQARTIFEELVADSGVPQARRWEVNGFLVSLFVVPDKKPGQNSFNYQKEQKEQFFGLELTIIGTTATGKTRTAYFFTGINRAHKLGER